jgi:hypothetical protein
VGAIRALAKLALAPLAIFDIGITDIAFARATNNGVFPGVYKSSHQSMATISERNGHKLLSIASRSDQDRGSATGADCELRALLDNNGRTWRLVPFSNETMIIRQSDLRGVNFYLSFNRNGSFKIRTNFAEINCSYGSIFDEYYVFFGNASD